jgi:hypothetical protein
MASHCELFGGSGVMDDLDVMDRMDRGPGGSVASFVQRFTG